MAESPFPGAGYRVQIDKCGFSAAHRISESHPSRRTFVQRKHIAKVFWKVAQEGEFGRTRISEYCRYSEFAQQSVSRFSYGAQRFLLKRLSGSYITGRRSNWPQV